MAGQSNALRSGKLRDNEQNRGWRAKLYGPTAKMRCHRVAYKNPVTKEWIYTTVADGASADDAFDEIEMKLNHEVALPAARSKAPTMSDLAVRYLEWLRLTSRDETYIRKVENLLDVWVLRRHGDLEVRRWSSHSSLTWIAAAREASRSSSRIEDLGSALSGLRSTAWRKDADGQRWLDRGDDPLENVNYTSRGTEQGVHRSFVPISLRPTGAHVESVLAAAEQAPKWPWLTAQMRIGLFCGPRLAEQLALRSVDIDFVGRKLYIRHSIRWGRPKAGISCALKPTKTKMRRESPYPGSMHDMLLKLCEASMGLACDATLDEVVAAQTALYDRHLRKLDDAVQKTGKPRAISPHEHLLFTDPATGLPPTKETFNDEWRKLRARSSWPASIPWNNARHHTVMWWRTVMVSGTGVPIERQTRVRSPGDVRRIAVSTR